MWMLSGAQKIQPKSGNRVAAGFLDILLWCERARLAVKKETILANVVKCYMTSEPGPKFDVEPKPEAMEVEEKPKEQKEKKPIVVVKSKTPAEFKRLALKKEKGRRRWSERSERKSRKKRQNGRGKQHPSGSGKQRQNGSGNQSRNRPNDEFDW